MWWLIIIPLIGILIFVIIKFRKVPKVGSLVLINGGVKSCKSTFCVYMAFRKYRKNLFVWRIKYALLWFFKRLNFRKFKDKALPEKPLLYSNIPLKVPYVPVTLKMLLREERFAYKSVIFLDEASLIADSMSYGDKLTDEQLLLFVKLIGHETHGGTLFINTQSIADMHHAFKKCIDTYFNIHHAIKWVPFFILIWVRECKYSYDNNAINTYDSDVEDTLKFVLVPKSTWKKFDQFAFSYFTDDLHYSSESRIAVDMKVTELVSFRKWISLKKGVPKK